MPVSPIFLFVDYSGQTTGFQIYVNNTDGSPLYIDTRPPAEYDEGIFNITLEPEVVAESFIVRRAQEYLTICEFEAYEGKLSVLTLQ